MLVLFESTYKTNVSWDLYFINILYKKIKTGNWNFMHEIKIGQHIKSKLTLYTALNDSIMIVLNYHVLNTMIIWRKFYIFKWFKRCWSDGCVDINFTFVSSIIPSAINFSKAWRCAVFDVNCAAKRSHFSSLRRA